MSSNTTTVRVQLSTKELISKHSKRLGISQNELIEKAILSAEKNNFSEDLLEKNVMNHIKKREDQIIRFLKTQDKNMLQMEKNIYSFFRENVKDDRRETLEYFYLNSLYDIQKQAEIFYKENPQRGEQFYKRFKEFFYKTYTKLVTEIKTVP